METSKSSLSQTIFDVPKMDCPSEERMVRMALEGHAGIRSLRFDLSARRLTVTHTCGADEVLARLEPLNFGAQIAATAPAPADDAGSDIPSATEEDATSERSVLKLLLAINALMFFVEAVCGWWAQSMGLLADSLDMFADAAVYGLSLYAVGRPRSAKQQAARLSGYFQLLLAVGALAEAARRFIVGSEPESWWMIGIGALALVANVSCMLLLRRHREGEVHMRASWIFSTNDVIANLGVIVAGALAAVFHYRIPDLIVGTIIAALVFQGALKILRLAKATG